MRASICVCLDVFNAVDVLKDYGNWRCIYWEKININNEKK